MPLMPADVLQPDVPEAHLRGSSAAELANL
jgi:hypothetical protein